jgi:hypothetical protein
MRRGEREGLPVELETLAKRLDAYRSRRGRQGSLPERFWTQAAHLARRYGLYRVQRVLRLNYYGRKQRVDELATPFSHVSPSRPERLRAALAERGREGIRAPCERREQPAFFELGIPSSLAWAMTTLEVEDGSGRKLSVRLAREDSRELVALARAVWGGAL